jgi:hypothetical protein
MARIAARARIWSQLRPSLGPDLPLDGSALLERRPDSARVGVGEVEGEARVDVVSHALLQDPTVLKRKEVESQIGAADGVRLFDNQLAPVIEPRCGPGEREREQQAHEAEDSAPDRAEALADTLTVPRVMAPPQASSKLDQDEHSDKESSGEPHPGRDLVHHSTIHSSSRSRPTMTRPRNHFLAASTHICSVMAGSSAGTKCESTSVATPAACATRPTSSAVV